MAKNPQQILINKLKQAQQELAVGNPAKALKMFEKLLKPSNNNPDILYLMSLANGKMGKIDQVEKYSRRALKKNPNHNGALCSLANAQFVQGDMQGALVNYEKALTINPSDESVVDNYCKALNSIGRQAEALDMLDKILARNPQYAPAHAAKGIAFAVTGQPEKATQSFEMALKIDPLQVDANLGMGNLCRFNGQNIESTNYYEKVLSVEPTNVLAYVGLASMLRLLGNHDEALEVIAKAEKLVSYNTTLISTKADILEHAGRHQEAFDLLKLLKENNQLLPLGVASYVNMCGKFEVCEEALEILNHTIKLPATTNLDKEMLYFCAGRHLDKLNRFDEAFENYKLANNCVETKFDKVKDLEFVDETIKAFDEDFLKSYNVADTGSSRPLFILGMPRSGTSLTEQILASHVEVYGGGELGDIAGIASAIKQQQPSMNGGYVTRMSQVPEQAINDYASKYLKTISELDDAARFVTDKMPHNFLHVGLISLLFPDARIIHCTRNPLDNILSIYFQHFSGMHTYSHDLENLALYYNAYHRLMQHWQKVIKTPILTLKYEDMVEDQEATSRKLLAFCNLEWSDDVLNFHKSSRSVATASYDQVRQPMYKSSKERWRNYEKYLDVVKTTLSNAS